MSAVPAARPFALDEPVPEPAFDELRSSWSGGASPMVDALDASERDVVLPPAADVVGEVEELEVVPVRAEEFVCSSCFLVHHRAALADPDRQRCRDCS